MIEKIKLEWEKGICGNESEYFSLNKNTFRFGVYPNSGYVKLYKTEKDREVSNDGINFPQEYPINSKEQGRKFCQDWLDNLIEKENRKERVQKVLEDIWSGRTKLKWENQSGLWYFAKVITRNKHYVFYVWSVLHKITLSFDNEDFEDIGFPNNQQIFSDQEGIDLCQDWYNKFLLAEALK